MKGLITISLVVFLLSACGGDKVKPPSEESRLAGEASALAERLRTLYVNKDLDGLKKYLPEADYREMQPYDKVALEFTPRFVEIDDLTKKVYLNISWIGSWTVDGLLYDAGGMAVFELKGSPLEVIRIIRGSPFQIPDEAGRNNEAR